MADVIEKEKWEVSTHQIDAEVDVLIGLIRESGARSFLEIGSKYGATLWRIARSMPSGSRIVSVDLNVNDDHLARCIEALRAEGYDASLIPGNSMDPAVVEKARALGPYDAIFIDGNHKLQYVSSDWAQYGPMGKLVAFHDIGWRRATPASPGRILVPEFWDSIKDDHKHREIMLDPEGNAYGIGVIWRDPEIDSVLPYTMTGRDRLEAMREALRRVDREGIVGDIVECGVWKGGNIILARRLSPERRCWLFDTFAGMTAPGPEDISKSGVAGKPGTCAVSIEEVFANLKATGTYSDDHLEFVAGDVNHTLRSIKDLPEKIAILRLDTDWYESTKVELEVLYPRLASGGVLIVDDYGHWKGARKAVDEYFGASAPQMKRIDYTGVMMVKP